MSNPPSKLALLQHIINNLRLEPIRPGPITQTGLQDLQMFIGKMGPSGIAGIRFEAAEAVNELAEAIFTGSPYQHGATFEAVAKKLTDTIILNYADKANAAIDANDMAFVEKCIADWFQEQIASHELYIPCFISRWYRASFSIGPIRFAHLQDFAPQAKSDTGAMFDISFGPFFELMQRNGAYWIATVKVEGCTKDRAQEIANLAVDVALAGLQLCIREEEARHMARMTGRTMPVFRQAVSRTDGELWMGATNTEPGYAFGPGFLDKRLADAKPLLDSVANRVTAYVGRKARLAKIEQAWADAAYWYHEGLAEPLDTIAVPKLAAAIENLLQKSKHTGSEARVLKVICTFYGKKDSDLMNQQSQMTVKQFAKGFVGDRSCFLHGTRSTLKHSLHASRPNLTMLVHGLLTHYSLELDQYAASASPEDEVAEFLNFVDVRRQANAAPATP